MKSLFLSIIALGSFSTYAIEAYCKANIEKTVSNMISNEFTIESISSEAVKYSGFHMKEYKVSVELRSKEVTTYTEKRVYTGDIFEFETPGTNCEIESLKLSIR